MGPQMKRAVDVLMIAVGIIFIARFIYDTSPHPAYFSLLVGPIAIGVGAFRIFTSFRPS
jgi:hypothetical protein